MIIGPFPPPYGGVSIHIKRLKEHLSGCLDIDIIDEARTRKPSVFNLRSMNIAGYIKRIYRANIVHIHSGRFSLRLTHFLVSSFLLRKTIITIHAYEPGRGMIEKMLDKWMLNAASKKILVSKEIAGRLGIRNYIMKEAFLPPAVSDEADLPAVMENWISEQKQKGYVICSANAWRLDSHKNEDVYGLDLCISAATMLRDQCFKIAFVFVVCEGTGIIPVSKYRELISSAGIGSCFLLFESPVSFIRLIIKSDIVVRPTNTDGDALTVREGLYFHKTVIASDVVIRPPGTKLFKNRDVLSLVNSIKELVNKDDKNLNLKSLDHSGADYQSYYLSEVYT